MKTQPARIGIVAVVGLLIGAVTAMVTGSGSSTPSAEVALIAHSADAAADAGSAKADFSMTMSGSGFPSMEMSGDAAFDFQTQSFAMTMGVGSGPAGAGFDTEMRLIGTTMYMRMPAGLGAPTPWISLDLSAVGGEALSGMGAGTDVTQTLEYLRGAGDVTVVGPDTVRGVPTTHYRARIDLGRAIDDIPDAQRAQMEAAMEQFEAMSGASSFPVDVWIDDAGLARKMTYNVELDTSALGDIPGAEDIEVSMTFAMEIYDYGQPVSVSPPPAAQVTDMTSNVDALTGLQTF